MGFFYAAMILLTQIVQTLLLQHYFHRMFVVGVRLRTAFMNLIYRKVKKLTILTKICFFNYVFFYIIELKTITIFTKISQCWSNG